MKYGIFIDLDGTLLNEDGAVSLFDKKIIRDIKESINIYLVTGKSYFVVKNIYEDLGLNTKFITSMGQVVTSADGLSVYNGISAREVVNIVDKIREVSTVKNFAIEYTGRNFYLSSKLIDGNLLDLIDYKFGNDVGEYLLDDGIVIGAFVETNTYSEKEILSAKKKLNNFFEGEYNFTYWKIPNRPYVIYIRNSKTNKWIEISKIIQDDELDKIMCIGNGWNDIEMIRNADYGVAMINSEPNVIENAKYTTHYSNNESGVGKFIDKNRKIFK